MPVSRYCGLQYELVQIIPGIVYMLMSRLASLYPSKLRRSSRLETQAGTASHCEKAWNDRRRKERR